MFIWEGDIMAQYMIRYFKCSKCGKILPASKKKKMTGQGHIKTMYCPYCKIVCDAIQLEQEKTR
jgi:phage FluMu protein Com